MATDERSGTNPDAPNAPKDADLADLNQVLDDLIARELETPVDPYGPTREISAQDLPLTPRQLAEKVVRANPTEDSTRFPLVNVLAENQHPIVDEPVREYLPFWLMYPDAPPPPDPNARHDLTPPPPLSATADPLACLFPKPVAKPKPAITAEGVLAWLEETQGPTDVVPIPLTEVIEDITEEFDGLVVEVYDDELVSHLIANIEDGEARFRACAPLLPTDCLAEPETAEMPDSETDEMMVFAPVMDNAWEEPEIVRPNGYGFMNLTEAAEEACRRVDELDREENQAEPEEPEDG